jgi:hypothetical protein
MDQPGSPDRAVALRKAWWTWGMLAGFSLVAMLVVLPLAARSGGEAPAWVLVPVFWLALAVPATVGVYGHCFAGEWRRGVGDPASPGDYLRGVSSVWSVLAVGVGLSLIACLLAGAASPGVWPGALMLMLLVLARPSLPPTAAPASASA